MIETGVMSASDLDLLNFVDDAEEAWARLVELGLLTQQP
jgi:predicted Rossmann-fold nucleotide-binding protein